jgi:hypothetical protein
MAELLEEPPKLLYNKAEQNKIRFAHCLADNGGDIKNAYREVFPDAQDSTVDSNAHQYAKNDLTKSELSTILVSGGITDNRVGLKLSKMLDIDKEYYDNKGKLRVVRDNQTQMQALRTILQLKGYLGNGNTNVDARSVTINQVSDVHTEQLSSVVESLKSMNAQLVGDSDAQTGKIEDVVGIRPVEEK